MVLCPTRALLGANLARLPGARLPACVTARLLGGWGTAEALGVLGEVGGGEEATLSRPFLPRGARRRTLPSESALKIRRVGVDAARRASWSSLISSSSSAMVRTYFIASWTPARLMPSS